MEAHCRHRSQLPIFVPTVDSLINARDLANPAPPFGVFQIQNRFGRPVKVVCNEGYLLVQCAKGVA
jgi:hypothetical protein